MKRLVVITFALWSILNVPAYSFNGNGSPSVSSMSNIDDKHSQKGYKASFEIGYTHGIDEGIGRAAVFTTHGYQFNPYLFVGGGVGVNRFLSEKAWGVPVFAKVRVDMFNKSISPFIDAKVGYSITNVNGFYFSPSLGCRFDNSNDFSITISFGYELQMSDYEVGNFYYIDDIGTIYLIKNKKKNCGGITLRLGFEF